MSRTSAYKVRINTHSSDVNALILLADGVFAGILVELEDECHEADQGKWAIEAAFAIDGVRASPTFSSAAEAADWLSSNLACGKFTLDGELAELR